MRAPSRCLLRGTLSWARQRASGQGPQSGESPLLPRDASVVRERAASAHAPRSEMRARACLTAAHDGRLAWGWEWWQASATGPRNALEFSEKGGTSVTARFEGLKKGRRGRLFPVSFGEHGVSSRCGRHADFELSECRIGPLRPAIARREA